MHHTVSFWMPDLDELLETYVTFFLLLLSYLAIYFFFEAIAQCSVLDSLTSLTSSLCSTERTAVCQLWQPDVFNGILAKLTVKYEK